MSLSELKKKKKVEGLCFRCEYRATFLEGGSRPRYQCGDIEHSSASCYMFKPVAPIILKREKGDKRPLMLNALSCRVTPIEMAQGEYVAKKHRLGILVYWRPSEGKKMERNQDKGK